jgi:hypothetical protein
MYLLLDACRTHLFNDAKLFAENVRSLVEIGSAAFRVGELLLRLPKERVGKGEETKRKEKTVRQPHHGK